MTTESIRIPVEGMTCAACSARVQRALQREPGVADANVNLMMKTATVHFDPAAVTPDRLVEAIEETGYGARLASPDQSAFEEQEERDRATTEEFHELRRKAIVSAIVGIVAMAGSMPLTRGLGLRAVTSTLQEATLGFMLWAGREFYTRGWAAFRHHSADMNTLIALGTGAAILYSVVATVVPQLVVRRGMTPDV
jgi:Cu+-exporting ATPase